MPNVAVTIFNNGEVTPYIDARSDVEKYASSCRTLENMLPLIYGPATRRSGTKYVSTAKSTPKRTRMVPFIYSADIAYTCEFGDCYIRFYYDGAPLLNGTTPVEVTSTYALADLWELQFRQIGDTMWIVHPSYAPAKLTRTSTTAFSLDDIVLEKGPFLTRNDLVDPDDPAPTTLTYSETHREGLETGDNTQITLYGSSWASQTFLVTTSYSIKRVAIRIFRSGTSPGNITVGIRACTTNNPATAKPTGADLTTGYIWGNTVTTATPGEWIWVSFPDSYVLTGDTMYAIVVRAVSGSASHFIYWRQDNSSPGYTDGCWVSSANSGSTWTVNSGQCTMFINYSDDATLVASADTFESGHVGALFRLTYPRIAPTSYGAFTVITETGTLCFPIDVKGTFSFTSHGLWTGTLKLQRSERGDPWEDYRTYTCALGDANAALSATEEATDVQYQAVVTTHSAGTISAEITVHSSTEDVIFRVATVTNATTAVVTTVSGNTVADTTKRWAEGAWSAVRGYPGAIAFFEDRCVYAGSPHDPQGIWPSETGDYEDFEEGVNDSDSFGISLTTTNEIRWIAALESLVAGTSGGPWVIESSKLSAPLTPSPPPAARQQSTMDSKAIQAIEVNDVILFVDKPGRRIREFVYQDARQKYVAPDLCALAEHVTKGIITSIAHQKHPESIVWCTLADGGLISMTYERDQNVIGWARHPMSTGTLVDSVAVIPGTTEDEVWLSTRRLINGATKSYIEQMQPRDFGSLQDAFFVDCGILYEGTPADRFSGLDHLEGCEVVILGDGAVFPRQTVTHGAVTTTSQVSPAVIGLPYRYTLEPMRLDVTTQGGTSKGSYKKSAELVVSFYETGGAKYGKSIDKLKDIKWRTMDELLGSPPALFTGDKTLVFDGGFDTEDHIIISGDDPLPCTVRAIVARMDVVGR